MQENETMSPSQILFEITDETDIPDSGDQQNRKKPKKSKKKIFTAVIAVIAAVCFLASYYLYLAKAVPNRCDANYEYIMSLFGQSGENLPNGADQRLGAIYDINSDLGGIVQIENTKINYPFVKADGHSALYYQSHLFNFTRCNYGTIFSSDGYLASGYNNNTVLFGQNTNDGRMFSSLGEYTDIRFYKENPIVKLYNLFSESDYKIFAVCLIENGENFGYTKDNFANETAVNLFVGDALEASMYYTNLTAAVGDRFLTMVSDYEYGGQIVIIARTLHEDEQADVKDDYIQYKSVGSPYSEQEKTDVSEVTDAPDEQIIDTTDAVVTDEGKLPQNDENAGAILPDVTESAPIVISSVQSSSSVLPSSSSQSSSEQISQNQSQIYIVTTQSTSLNVRSGPSTADKIIGTLARGSAVTISEVSNGWGHVVSGSIDGWASMDYLTLQSEIGTDSSSEQIPPSSPSSSAGSSESTDGYAFYNASAANEVITVVSSLGNTYTESAYSIICRIVEIEVGSGYPVETIKAQAVASYSYIMYRVRRGATPSGVSMKAFSAVGARVKQCVAAVIGQTLVYDGKICDAYYSTCTAGMTNDVTDVWNSGTTIRYLTPVDSFIDKNYAGFTYTKTMTAADVASRLKTYINTDVSGVTDKNTWIAVLGKNKSGVYNGSVSVAGKTTYTGSTSGATYAITGQRIYSIMNLRSAAFDVSYNASSDSFTFVTYGWGHGVGMSQVGAYYYVTLNGWNYQQVLTHYYPGASFRDYA